MVNRFKYTCIHGHFYQPPRENPWLEAVELQDSAHPYHDWNERITAECYAPNTASRIFDSERRIIDIVNNYSKMSFNFGPTLLSWMQRHQPDIYQGILEADRLSQQSFSGHGSAIAQVYNHMIMPLANNRDKYTQVIWGIRDFQKRFGRFPEGMWLPETAVDIETLEVLAELGIVFTILAPHQADKVRRIGSEDWKDVSGGHIDPSTAYLCQLPSGRIINLFFYDGPISGDLAFGALLTNGEYFANRLVNAFSDQRDWPQIVHIATDGESYGHHHRAGEMALSYCLYHIDSHKLAAITVYGQYLEKHPPTHEVKIVENTSWSCIHGIERWWKSCGCHSGGQPLWTQAWREPLRNAMDWLRDTLIPLYEQEAAQFLKDPWKARNDYIEVVLDRSKDNVENFIASHTARELSLQEKSRVLMLLEMQRHTMLMYTSCGWFFDEISGIETTQIMKYAARAIQLAEKIFPVHLETDFIRNLEKAPSNIQEFQNGANVYERFVKPAIVDFLRVGAHYALSSLFEERLEDIDIYCYSADSHAYERMETEGLKLGVGRSRIVSDITWDESLISFVALHLGGQNVRCAVIESIEDETFSRMYEELKNALSSNNRPELLRLIDQYFGSHSYTLWHLFKDEQKKILSELLKNALKEIETSFRQIIDDHYGIMNFLKEIQVTFPKPLAFAASFLLSTDLRKICEEEEPNIERLQNMIEEAKRWPVTLDSAVLGYKACLRVNNLMEKVASQPENIALLERVEQMLQLLSPLSLDLNLWKAQNIYFALAKNTFPDISKKAAEGDVSAQHYLKVFQKIGNHLQVKVIEVE